MSDATAARRPVPCWLGICARLATDSSDDRLADAGSPARSTPDIGFRNGAVAVSWWNLSAPLWYAQHVDGRRRDLTIVDDRTLLDEHLGSFIDVIDTNLGRWPVYAIRFDPADRAAMTERHELRGLHLPLAQPVHEILGRRGG
ncbi:MAG TPA: hypothetical protein VFI28_10080 [Candidatus Limnocylindrales bacterium]|nr:hypothetical protein [Candidatus Limnocylindrales bacterium]